MNFIQIKNTFINLSRVDEMHFEKYGFKVKISFKYSNGTTSHFTVHKDEAEELREILCCDQISVSKKEKD